MNFRLLHTLSGMAVVALMQWTLTASRTEAQPTFSIDFQGPTVVSGAVTEGDILMPAGTGMFGPPGMVLPAPMLGILTPPDSFMEVDALSYGGDRPLIPDIPQGMRQQWMFSVDEFAIGDGAGSGPSVTTEGAAGAREASADIYGSNATGFNVGLGDGNGGLTPFGAPGHSLSEPNPPTLLAIPDVGDNLDAVDVDTPPHDVDGGVPVFFSLDSRFPDPLETGAFTVPNTGSAAANGFVGGDVLVTLPGVAGPGLYAPAPLLGLDAGGEKRGIDDLDALVLWDNGDLEYEPEMDWLAFSVRRGSGVIGLADSLLGMPIEEGDILIPPAAPGMTPGILVPAEDLGLATARSGSGASWGLPNPSYEQRDIWGDDLDALDVILGVLTPPGGPFRWIDLTPGGENYTIAAHWSPAGGPPTLGDDAVIANGGIALVDFTNTGANRAKARDLHIGGPIASGRLEISGPGEFESTGDLFLGSAGPGSMQVTGPSATVVVGGKLEVGGTGKFEAVIRGPTHTTVKALGDVVHNPGDTLAVSFVSVPATGAHTYELIAAGGTYTGEFDTESVPHPVGGAGDAIGRVNPVFYAGNSVFVGVAKPGDADFSGQVTAAGDGAILLANLGVPGPKQWIDADFNGDGVTSAAGDGALLLANMGAPYDMASPGPAVPEPGSLCLLAMSGIALGLGYRRRQAA